jgi:hypothetical protein
MPDRKLRRGEVPVTDVPDASATLDLVRVHHAGLGTTQVVRRQRLAQMDAGWEPVEPTDLKGQSLDEALETTGLPRTGSADEKRARLAEHEAAALAAASEVNHDPAVTTENTKE